ncbi:hypothetical protein AJ88_05270 [Mesorhizobium amorphae CCBAU 01583]|nr:hypothetical protein AJ88_05270 [Mesorhizobium amorphae CCBAU 01583]
MLTAIIMASDLLLTNHRPSDPSFPDIMNIKQNANRAASLVRQFWPSRASRPCGRRCSTSPTCLPTFACCSPAWSATTSS